MTETNTTLRIGIVADDLTGTADVAAGLAGRSLKTVGVFRLGALERAPDDARAIVADADSRVLSPGKAGPAFLGAADMLGRRGWPLTYKKIDSTLRGHVAEELAALLARDPHRSILLAPANPAAGRTTRDGVQHIVDAVPTGQAPDRRVSVLDLLEPTLAGRVVKIGTTAVRTGADAVRRELSRPGRIVVADAETRDDLVGLVKLARGCAPEPLLCGSAGLADALAVVVTGRREAAVPQAPRRDGPVAVLSTSGSAVTQAQLQQLEAEGRVAAACLDPTDPAAGPEPVGTFAVRSARQGQDVLVRAPLAGRPAPVSQEESAGPWPACVGRVAERLACEAGVRRWLVIGGQTAAAVCRAVGIEWVEWLGEIVPGIVAGRAAESVLAAKPGAFGDVAAVAGALDWFHDNQPS